jgi:hypothetical protein
MKTRSGQALVTLLVFISIALIITSTSIMVMIDTTRDSTAMELSTQAYFMAESGAENALIKLLRNPNYAGETLTVGSGVVTITVTGVSPKTVTSTAAFSGYVRKISVQTDYAGGIMTVSSWRELFI